MSVWPWIIGAVALVVALWAVAWLLDQDGEIPDPAQLSNDGIEAPEPVTVPAPANQ